ncbi:MAG: hypothetical protein KGZ31_05180 [Sulfuritalea sp.]|nr:hypothetical protein [Sulfuritalea sp.]
MAAPQSQSAQHGGPARRGPAARLLGLVLGFGALAALALVVAPNLARALDIEEGHAFLVDSGIEAGAFYYTQVERVALSESYVRSAQRTAVAARAAAL